jgi:hypothetical protein
MEGWWFSLDSRIGAFSGALVSSTNKTDRHNISEIWLKVALNTITPDPIGKIYHFCFKKMKKGIQANKLKY